MAWTDAMRKKAQAVQRRNRKLRAKGLLPPIAAPKKKGERKRPKWVQAAVDKAQAANAKRDAAKLEGPATLGEKLIKSVEEDLREVDFPLEAIPDNRPKKRDTSYKMTKQLKDTVKRAAGYAEAPKSTLDLQLIAKLIVAVAKELA